MAGITVALLPVGSVQAAVRCEAPTGATERRAEPRLRTRGDAHGRSGFQLRKRGPCRPFVATRITVRGHSVCHTGGPRRNGTDTVAALDMRTFSDRRVGPEERSISQASALRGPTTLIAASAPPRSGPAAIRPGQQDQAGAVERVTLVPAALPGRVPTTRTATGRASGFGQGPSVRPEADPMMRSIDCVSGQALRTSLSPTSHAAWCLPSRGSRTAAAWRPRPHCPWSKHPATCHPPCIDPGLRRWTKPSADSRLRGCRISPRRGACGELPRSQRRS